MQKISSNEQDRRSVFLKNLHDLMEKKSVDEPKLSLLLGFKPKGRKWLRRVCVDGLARSSKSTVDNLALLAKQLGLTHHDDFWKLSEQEPRTIRRMRDIEAWLKDADEISARTLLQEVERQIEQWCVRAKKLHDQRMDKIRRGVEARNFRRKLGVVWMRICARIAVEERSGFKEVNRRLLEQVKQFGSKMMGSSFRTIHPDLFMAGLSDDPLMKELTPYWEGICHAIMAEHPDLQDCRAVYDFLRESEKTHGTATLIADIQKRYSQIAWTTQHSTVEGQSKVDAVLRDMDRRFPTIFVDVVQMPDFRRWIEHKIKPDSDAETVIRGLLHFFGATFPNWEIELQNRAKEPTS